jgi:peptidoglycan/xylan/chitin deacetylase (PgdA/CDA1 family)
MESSPWPSNANAAISLTMDNLGEPLEIQLGRWPKEGPFGTHASVTKYLPQVLDILDKTNVKGTYFAEAWSLNVYSDAVKEIIRRGHEVGWHAYQHEAWAKLSPEEETENFARSLQAAGEIGIKYKGFRPPGGTITQTTRELLQRHDFQYVSHVVPGIAVKEGIVELPFQWQDIDAFYYEPELSFIRKKFDVQEGVLEPAIFKERLLTRIQETSKAKGHLAILFHPFLQTSEEKRAVMEDILARISNDPEIWCAPCDQVSEWIKGHPQSFPSH